MALENLPVALTAMGRVLKEACPAEFPLVESYLSFLYFAEQAGHTYIDVSKKDQIVLNKAQPIVGNGEEDTPLVLWHNKLFFARLFEQERYLAAWLVEQNRDTLTIEQDKQSQLEALLIKFSEQGLHEHQLQAVVLSLLKRFLLICGGPGTGKTTTVASILMIWKTIFSEKILQIALAAPTGKAASRMTEALHNSFQRMDSQLISKEFEALSGQTLHRLLGINPVTNMARYHSKNPLPFDIVIVDEASMLDLPLLTKLFSALKAGAHLILLGDPDQLPAIGAGAFVRQLSSHSELTEPTCQMLTQLLPQFRTPLSLEKVVQDGFATMLTFSHRFNQSSAIGQLASAINQQQYTKVEQLLQSEEKLGFMSDISQIYTQFYHETKDYWAAISENNYVEAFVSFRKLIVLVSLKYQGEQFNQNYRQYLYGKKHYGETWFAGLPVMVTENDYQQNLFNGDIGLVMYNEQQELAIFFETATGFREISLSRLPHFEPAFAITVHKSQGSEYQKIWLLAPEENHILFSRSLFYTAVTRAKEAFVFWGDLSLVRYALDNVSTRKSALNNFINHHLEDVL